jgi:hypothetical protein
MKRENLEDAIAEYRKEVLEMFPSLESDQLVNGTVSIGSSFSRRSATDDPEFRRFCQYELDLRVGIAHELLQEVRDATSLGYRFNNKSKMAWGVEAYQETAPAQKRAAAKRDRVASDYNYNWGKIQHILENDWIPANERTSKLRGLQKLDPKKDMKYFAPDGHQTYGFMGHLGHLDSNTDEVSWIWMVPMLGVATSSNREVFQRAVEEWVDECE